MVRTHEVTNKEHLASQVKNTMKNTDEEHKVYLAFNMHNKQKKKPDKTLHILVTDQG